MVLPRFAPVLLLVVTSARRLTSRTHDLTNCTSLLAPPWPQCARVCPPCDPQIIADNIRGPAFEFNAIEDSALQYCFMGEACAAFSECSLGACMCQKGYCHSPNGCAPRACTSGAVPPMFSPSKWVRTLAAMPGAGVKVNGDRGQIAWQQMFLSAIMVPSVLAAFGFIIAMATFACICGGLECECGLLPNRPWLVLAWACLTGFVLSYGIVSRYWAVKSSFGQARAQLVHFNQNVDRLKVVGHSLDNQSNHLISLINMLPASCIQQVKPDVQQAVTQVDVLQAISQDLGLFNGIIETLPPQLHRFNQLVDKVEYYFLHVPFLPSIVIFIACLSIVVTIMLSWCSMSPQIAMTAECVVLKYGSCGIGLMIVFVVILAAAWLETGIVLGGFCKDVDANVLRFVHGLEFKTKDNMTTFMGSSLTQLVHSAAEYYISGAAENPALTFLTDAANKLIETGLLVERLHILLDVTRKACETLDDFNVSQTILALDSDIDSVDGLLHARNVWPYYDVMVHDVACGNVVMGMCHLILMNTIVGIFLFPVLAILADIDLRRWATWKGNHVQAHDRNHEYAKVPQDEQDQEIEMLQSAALDVHSKDVQPAARDSHKEDIFAQFALNEKLQSAALDAHNKARNAHKEDTFVQFALKIS